MMRKGANTTGNFILIVYESKDVTLRSMSIAKWSTFNVGLDSKCHSFVHELLPVICHQFESPWIVDLVIMYLQIPFTIVILTYLYNLWSSSARQIEHPKNNTSKPKFILKLEKYIINWKYSSHELICWYMNILMTKVQQEPWLSKGNSECAKLYH